MERFNLLNKISGWGVFVIATIVYLMTVEPTASWWDCGEYIATAYKLQVGHPPGAPFFQILGRFFSMFAFGDTTRVALMVNIMSVLSSSFTILFLFWTITALAQKIAFTDNQVTNGKIYTIIGGGLVAWIGIALLTDKLPGARGARAVGSMFALVALGACSFFVTPLLLLDGSCGIANLVPFVATSVGLAAVFGLAARTGPPVPHYFTFGPLLLAPLAGISLLMASPGLLWVVTGLTAVLCLAAWVRHRVKLANGTEEPEPSPEEAAMADQQKLVKFGQKLNKKL